MREDRTTHRHCPATPAQSQPSPSSNVRPSSPAAASGAEAGNPGAEHDRIPSRLRSARSTHWWRPLLSKSRKLSSITWRAAEIHAQSKRNNWSLETLGASICRGPVNPGTEIAKSEEIGAASPPTGNEGEDQESGGKARTIVASCIFVPTIVAFTIAVRANGTGYRAKKGVGVWDRGD